MSEVIQIDENTFASEIENCQVPVLLEFGASWCGPCARQLPILQSLAKQYSSQLKVAKIDIDDCPELCDRFSIKSVPTLMILNQGNVLHSGSGLTNLQDLKSEYLSKVGI